MVATVTAKFVEVSGQRYYMTFPEWDQLKTWISSKKQENAMRWWADQYELEFKDAVGMINRIQIGLQTGFYS